MASDKSELFIKVARSIEDNFLWKPTGNDSFDARSAWIDLILQANVVDKNWFDGANHISIKRGQLVTSIQHLANRWNWSKKRVIKYLKMLETEGMIYKNSTSKYTTITLCKYCDYQDSKKEKRTANDTAKVTAGVTAKVTANDTQLKNVKNDKECIKNEKKPSAVLVSSSGRIWE